jgi:hypothetical protein
MGSVGSRTRRSRSDILCAVENVNDTLSPWIDIVTRARTEVFADLAAHKHRRFIKTHTPLDVPRESLRW